MNDVIYDFDDEQDAEKARLEMEKKVRDEELQDLRDILDTLAGRRFFVRLLAEGRVFASTFSTDAAAAAFNEGNRNFALRIFNDLVEAAPEAIPLLIGGGRDLQKSV